MIKMTDESKMNELADAIWASMHPCQVCRWHKRLDCDICEHCRLPDAQKRTGAQWNFWNGSVIPVKE